MKTLPKVTQFTVDEDELLMLSNGIALIASILDGSPHRQIETLAKAYSDANRCFSAEQYSVLCVKFTKAAHALGLDVEIVNNEQR